MSTTVLEALQNAKINFETIKMMLPAHPIYDMALEQLSNGLKALENDMSPNDVIQENMFDDVNTSK